MQGSASSFSAFLIAKSDECVQLTLSRLQVSDDVCVEDVSVRLEHLEHFLVVHVRTQSAAPHTHLGEYECEYVDVCVIAIAIVDVRRKSNNK